MMKENLTLKQVFDLFIDSGCTHWASSTLAYYKKNLGYFVQYAEQILNCNADALLISDLPENILVQYVIFLRRKLKYNNHPLKKSMSVDGTIKSNTVNTYTRAVKAFFNYLYTNHLIFTNYLEGLKLPRPDSDQIIPLLNKEVCAIDAVFNPLDLIDLRNLCMIHLMLDAGLRSGEVITLQVKDIIFDANIIVINRGKGDKSRAVIMCPPLAALLHNYIEMSHPSGCLFKKVKNNERINQSVFKSLFLRIRRKTGIERLHPHLLRHTFATSYIMGGGNLETLRILMGHYDYSVTRKYLHLASQNQILKTDIYRLDSIFFQKSY